MASGCINITPNELRTSQGRKRLFYIGEPNYMNEIGMNVNRSVAQYNSYCGNISGGELIKYDHNDFVAAYNAGAGYYDLYTLANGNKICIYNDGSGGSYGPTLYGGWRDVNGNFRNLTGGRSYPSGWEGFDYDVTIWFFTHPSYPGRFGWEVIRWNANHDTCRGNANCSWWLRGEYSNSQYAISEWETLVNGAEPINYNWKSVKALALAKPSELGLPGMPTLPDNNQTDMLLSYIPDDYLNNAEPVSDGTHFDIKAPSLSQYITEYNDSSFTERSIFLSNKHFVRIGRKSVGLSGEQYKFTFLSGAGVTPQITYYETTVNVGLGDGVPYLGFIIDPEHSACRLNIIFVKTSVDSATGLETRSVDYNTITMADNEMSQLHAWLNGSESQEEESDSGTENPTQGGNETDEVTNTPLNRPTLPTRGAVGSGFVKVYEVGDTELQDICEFMWDDSLLTNLGRLFSDPREIIVGLMVFPITPLHTTSNSPIYAGNLDTGVTGNLLTTEYETRYAGSRRVPKGNNDFMSFAPYRRIKINIPYCGEHELDPSAVFGATLKLYYHLSFFSGNCIAEVTRTFDGGDEEPIAFYGGQMGYSIPLSSEDFTRTLSSLISAGVTIGTALCTYGASSAAAATSKKAAVAAARQGSANAALTGSVAGAAGGLLNGSLAPNVSYNSGGGANSGFLGSQQPYLIIDEAITAYDKDQSSYIGYTSYQTKKLGDCVGYTKCLEAHIEGVHASDSELEEIMSWLTNGVLIHHDGTATPSTTPTVAGNTVITMMKLTSERNVIGKKWTDATQIEGQLIYDQSITSPSILVNGNSINFNYAYIGLFNRFYFVSDVIVRNKDLIEVKLKSDPLQSFKDEILDCYASVDRQKHNGNKFIDDPYMWTQVNNNVKILPFMDGGIEFDFGHTEDSYILTIAGKG